MSDEYMQVYLDCLSNQPKCDQTTEELTGLLRGRFEKRLPESVDRMMQLPAIILKNPSEVYLGLLLEARELFIAGHHYSCVAMCGIVSERLAKDVFRCSILVRNKQAALRPTD